jgi:hypothetical protein
MKRELDLQLIDKHAKIFKGGRFRHFECGDGWYALIDDMATKLQARIDASGCEQMVANQFKEKFGEVRFYFSGGDDDEIRAIVDTAEALSRVTCDYCGAPGTMGSAGGWMRVRCEAHVNTRHN